MSSNVALRLDDPLTWGIPPARTYLRSHMTRWILGASDISVFSAFFRKGQVFEMFRGTGIYQPAIDTAIEKLRHLKHLPSHRRLYFAELVDTPLRRGEDGLARLRRFKWGMCVSPPPLSSHLPKTGPPILTSPHDHPYVDNRCFDTFMPEGRHAPWKYLLRLGARLSVAFGAPVSPAAVHGALGMTTREVVVPGAEAEAQEEARRRENREMRIALTEVVQRAVGTWTADVGESTHWPGGWGYSRHYHHHCRREHEWTPS
ncbi:hypothetical protein EDB86DRAFT_3107499 [Lactarius hatsudake]|nr:hypothetical protein EDB86DRAFT_3107499 [Lactarius hatsudake]